jgi:hypothetical protein
VAITRLEKFAVNSEQITANRQRRAIWGVKLVTNREIAYGVGVVSIIAALSIALTLQGWRSRIPAFDLLPYIHSVHNFLETGVVPQHGDTGSYGSYKPAGTAWLMLPSALLFSDIRLSEYVGTALLHILTLSGVYLLARYYFGLGTSILAVLFYGLSEHSLFLAGSLWPNGRPDIYIWIVYFTHRWVTQKEARYAAAALAVWGLGMYVDMAILPVVALFPVVWLIYRPPLRIAPLALTSVVVLAVWSPYLRFEAGRGFADMRSQVLQQNIFPADYRQAWCDETLTLATWTDNGRSAETVVVQAGLANALGDKLLYNYRPLAPVPGASMALLWLTLGAVVILCVPGAPVAARDLWPFRWWVAAAGVLLLGVLVYGFILTARLVGIESILRGSIFLLLNKLQVLLMVSGTALLAGLGLATVVNRILVRAGITIQSTQQAGQTRLMAIALLVPWFILLLFAEPGKPERFMWLWPMQSLFLAAFFTVVLPRLRAPRAVIWAGALLAVLLVAANPTLTWKVAAWASSGWAGSDAAEVQLVDTVAHQIKIDGRERASIGYQMFIYPFMANYHITNPLYKVGAEFDALFLFRHGIENSNRCAEGVVASDEYRILEIKPKPPDWAPREYFLVGLDERFDLVDQFGTYQVYRRDIASILH